MGLYRKRATRETDDDVRSSFLGSECFKLYENWEEILTAATMSDASFNKA